VYKFEHVQELHENIVLLLNSICNYLTSKSYELQNHETKRYIGLNIDNFVNTFSYDIFMMREKVNLFISYIEFFHSLHGKFLTRFSKKMQFMMDQLNSDVNFEKKEEKNVEKPEGRFQKMFQSGVKKVGNVLSFIQNSRRETEENKLELIQNIKEEKEVNIEMFVNPLEEMNYVINERNDIVEPIEILVESVTENIIDKMVEIFEVVDEPLVESVVEEPHVEEPVVQEPVVQEPAMEEPLLEPLVE
jgi:hypothetical protein